MAKSIERGSSIAGVEGFGRGHLGPASRCAVRGRDIECDPVDRAGEDRSDRRDRKADAALPALMRMKPSLSG